MRRILTAVLTGVTALALLTGTAQASSSGWARHGDHYVHWKIEQDRPLVDDPLRDWQQWLVDLHHAIVHAKKANDKYEAKLALARQAAAQQTYQPPSPDYGVGAMQSLVSSKFAPLGSGAVSTAMCVVNRETGGTWDPGSDNPNSSAGGLWQFLESTWNNYEGIFGVYGSRYDPYVSTTMAVLVVTNYGWHDWHASDGSCGT